MSYFKKLLSYLYPVIIKSIPSSRSGTLEITMVNGKLVIDAEHANYSYGSLQKVLKKGLLSIGKPRLEQLNSILVLGVAGGSVIQTLREDFHIQAKITGIEIDEQVLSLANQYFNLNKMPNLELKVDDAFEYISETKDTYDLIIVDIFNDMTMPEHLFNEVFWVDIYKTLNDNGICLFNSIVSSKENITRNQHLTSLLKTIFPKLKLIKTQQINEVFILQK